MLDLVLDHRPGGKTFFSSSLNRNFSIDLAAIFLGREPQRELVHQAVSHGHNRTVRRPAKLTKEQSAAAIAASARVRRLERFRDNFPGQHPDYSKASLAVKSAKRKVVRDAEKKMREEWTSKQSVEDITRQLEGKPLETYQPAAARPMSPAQQRMSDALRAPLINDYQALLQRRANAIKALVAYCAIEEHVKQTLWRKESRDGPLNFVSPKGRTSSS